MNTLHTSEFSVIRFIAQHKSIEMLNRFDPAWISVPIYKKIVEIWRNDNGLLDELRLVNSPELARAMVEFPGVETESLLNSIYRTRVEHDVAASLEVAEERYLQRRIYRLGKMLTDNASSQRPAVLSFNAQRELQDLTVKGTVIQKLEAGFSDIPSEGLIKFGNTVWDEDIVPTRQEIITIGGKSGHFKTSRVAFLLLRSLIHNVIVLKNTNFKVMYFSKEMSWKRIYNIIITILYGQAHDFGVVDVKTGNYPKDKIEKLFREEYPFVNDNFILIPPQQIRTIEDVMKFMSRYKPDLWALDYLQLFALGASNNKASELNSSTAESIANLHYLTKTTDSLGIVLSNMRKFDGTRITSIPKSDDLEWSGLINQISSFIGLMYYPRKYFNLAPDTLAFTIWDKTRDVPRFNETLKVLPKFSLFEPMPTPNLYKQWLEK